MDADALLHPRGPLPPGIYWRRRLLTLAGVLLVLLVLTRACGSDGAPTGVGPSPSPSSAAPTGGTPTSTPTARPTRSATATPTPAATPGGPCRPADLAVNARADAQRYAPGQRPVLTIGIVNEGAAPCTFDVGQANREIRVTSGNDRVWSSDDCSPGGQPQVVTLRPGGPATTFSVTWSRTRSAPGCPGERREAPPGTYRVTGRFGNLTSAPDSFSLT